MTLQRIWAGWRAAYIESVTSEPADAGDCLFCSLAAADPDDALVLARDELVFAVMNAYPYVPGHLMLAPLRHEAELDGLTEDEAAALMVMTQRATTALKAAFRPDGLNVGINVGRAGGAGVPGHVHVHALPRWGGDTNFMTTVAETRVLPEDIRTSWQKLKDAWPAR
ncbi:MAG TPA: HIT domain-containing protein [Acidimicrobiia bacterium]|nr:HIT domain-containing protein [Acidimicrobiia bacterium]